MFLSKKGRTVSNFMESRLVFYERCDDSGPNEIMSVETKFSAEVPQKLKEIAHNAQSFPSFDGTHDFLDYESVEGDARLKLFKDNVAFIEKCLTDGTLDNDEDKKEANVLLRHEQDSLINEDLGHRQNIMRMVSPEPGGLDTIRNLSSGVRPLDMITDIRNRLEESRPMTNKDSKIVAKYFEEANDPDVKVLLGGLSNEVDEASKPTEIVDNANKSVDNVLGL